MSFTEQQLCDALGVGGKEPEVADPAKAAQGPTEEGAREPETAEPAEEGTEAQEPTGAKAEPEETTPAGQQTEEQRREMAARSRRPPLTRPCRRHARRNSRGPKRKWTTFSPRPA